MGFHNYQHILTNFVDFGLPALRIMYYGMLPIDKGIELSAPPQTKGLSHYRYQFNMVSRQKRKDIFKARHRIFLYALIVLR